MPQIQEDHYEDNGFELVVYKQRQSDPFKTCPDCQSKVFPVAGIYDEWEQHHSTTTDYDYCKKCKHIIQTTKRERPEGNTIHHQFHLIPPHEMLVELLAHARHIQGRGITRLTINRRWWSAWRYPLAIGNRLSERIPRAWAKGGSEQEPGSLQDDQVRHQTPLPRYHEREAPQRNPFTSRRTTSSDDSSSDTPEPGDGDETRQ
jgi:hypothetical protein